MTKDSSNTPTKGGGNLPPSPALGGDAERQQIKDTAGRLLHLHDKQYRDDIGVIGIKLGIDIIESALDDLADFILSRERQLVLQARIDELEHTDVNTLKNPPEVMTFVTTFGGQSKARRLEDLRAQQRQTLNNLGGE